jgi:hypothetical protein
MPGHAVAAAHRQTLAALATLCANLVTGNETVAVGVHPLEACPHLGDDLVAGLSHVGARCHGRARGERGLHLRHRRNSDGKRGRAQQKLVHCLLPAESSGKRSLSNLYPA